MNIHDYGFQWGPMRISRRYLKRGGRAIYLLGIRTEDHDVEVSVSTKGRSVRVWIDGRELR